MCVYYIYIYIYMYIYIYICVCIYIHIYVYMCNLTCFITKALNIINKIQSNLYQNDKEIGYQVLRVPCTIFSL